MAVSARRLSASEAVAHRQQRVRELESELEQWEREFEAQRARRSALRAQRRGLDASGREESSTTGIKERSDVREKERENKREKEREKEREERLRRERDEYERQRRERLEARTQREEELRRAAEREAAEQRRQATQAHVHSDIPTNSTKSNALVAGEKTKESVTEAQQSKAEEVQEVLELGVSPASSSKLTLPTLLWRASYVVEESDVRVGEGYDVALLAAHFAAQGRVSAAFALALVERATVLLRAEANVVNVTAPCVVVGDLHGQYYDLLELLRVAGPLWGPEAPQFVFLGDYVDRGAFSLETLLLLLAAKVTAPQRVWLLRGNHETRAMNALHSFAREVTVKLRSVPNAYATFATLFDALPIAAYVRWTGGDVLCVHGGLSQNALTLDELQSLTRTCEPEDDSALLDVLWADPLPESAPAQLWKENVKRGCGTLFGYDALSDFLETNGLTMLVRGHEVQAQGYEERWYRKWNPDATTPKLITLFSAPNYCDKYGNLGAVMRLEADATYSIQSFAWQPHPYVLPDFSSALDYSLPFVAEQTLHFLLAIMKRLHEPDLDDADQETQSGRPSQEAQGEGARSSRHMLREAVRAMLRVKLWRRERQDALVPAHPTPATLALARGVHEAHALRRAHSAMISAKVSPTQTTTSVVPRKGMSKEERRAWFDAVCAEDASNERLVRDLEGNSTSAAPSLRRTHSSRF